MDQDTATEKTYTYFYGKDHTLQNFPYVRELSFSNCSFKNIYYYSIQYDLKSIENKIGRYSEPLLNHPYYQEKIKLKQEEFDSKSSKFLEAGNKPVVQPTGGEGKIRKFP